MEPVCINPGLTDKTGKRRKLMKQLLATFAIAAITIFAGTSVYAQGWWHNGGGQGYHHGCGNGSGYMNYMKDELNLTDSQVEKIFNIDADYRTKYYQNRNSNVKIASLREEHRKAVYNVLSEDQKKIFDKSVDNRRGNGYGYGYCSNWN